MGLSKVKRYSFFAALLGAIFLGGCGAEPKQDCVANYLGQGLSLKISLVSGETYRFELCGDARITYPAFTVYGALAEADISQPTILSRYRLSHVTGNRSGDYFEVTFSSDLYFVIFADTQSSGSLQYSNATELIRGNLSQASLVQQANDSPAFAVFRNLTSRLAGIFRLIEDRS